MRKRVAILGSTGSIGTQALDVVARHSERFEIVGLAAGHQVERLREQTVRFSPPVTAWADDGPEGLLRVAVGSKPDVLLAATDGFVAFEAVFAALERGTDIAVANKELIVAAGELMTAAARRSGSRIVPVDSEHSAIFQCLIGEDVARVAGIVLTASGGPFRLKSREEMETATLEAALAHPTWRMGVKNTVDSATMMNKGLEVIEASRLFGIPADRIRIVVHPQSIAHGLVIFTDGSVKAQLAAPDMRLPIGYALAYPDRLLEAGLGPASPDPLAAMGASGEAPHLGYDFERADPERFPCLRLAYEALSAGGTMPAILSAANEIAVEAFVRGELAFGRIAGVVEKVMREVESTDVSLRTVLAADRLARDRARAAAALVSRIEV